MSGVNKKLEVAAGLVYVVLFVYVCVLRPAPEQRLTGAVPVEANPAAVAAILEHEGPRPLASCSLPSFPLEAIRWAAGERFSIASLLTACEQVDFSVQPGRDGSALLRGEMRWQARGGLLGNMLNSVLTRSSRQAVLADCLTRLRRAAENPTRTNARPLVAIS